MEIRARARQSSGMQVTFVHGTLLSSMNEDGTGLKTFFNGFNQNNSLHTLQLTLMDIIAQLEDNFSTGIPSLDELRVP